MNTAVDFADFCDSFLDKSSKGKQVTPPPGEESTPGKAIAALKNHSQAEKRRRERINGHFATLRSLIPSSSKMDKASLLEKAIAHLKELDHKASEATRGLVIPHNSDEIKVEQVIDVCDGEATVCIKASVCCDYKHEILADLKRSLNALHLKLVRVEMGTLGGRMKSVFFMTCFRERLIQDSRCHKYVSGSVQTALRAVLDSFSASQDLVSRDLFSTKRRRGSLVESADLW